MCAARISRFVPWLTSCLVACGIFAAVAARAQEAAPEFPASTNLVARLQGMLALSPDTPEGLTALAEASAALSVAAKQRSQHLKAEHREIVATNGLDKLSLAALREHYEEGPDALRVRDIRGLVELTRLAYQALAESASPARDTDLRDIAEIMEALRNNYRSALPETIGIITPWKKFFTDWQRDVGRGKIPAGNLATATGATNDMGMLDPVRSGFWSRPANLPAENLYAGFGRSQLPVFTNTLYQYRKPKITSGTHAGFEITANGHTYKLKFGELQSEPFTARIFHALGYHVDPTDYAPAVKVAYDRRMFREFNLRSSLLLRIRPLGIPAGSVELQPDYDPFQFVAYAICKDGRRVNAAELKPLLLRNPRSAHPENVPDNFRTEVETTIDYLVMQPANFQPEDVPTESIGQWAFGGLGHEQLRELRGAALLSAWLGWFDARQENNRLRITRENGRTELQYFFTDLGGGMGEATGMFHRRGEDPNRFTWTFTKPEIVNARSVVTSPFHVVDYETILPASAFYEMTADDARWMARLIAQLTEAQLLSALIGSGYDDAQARLYLEKLISRRDRMIRDLRLDEEIAPLRPSAVDQKFAYDPVVEAHVTAKLPSGQVVEARAGENAVQKGKLVMRKRPDPAAAE